MAQFPEQSLSLPQNPQAGVAYLLREYRPQNLPRAVVEHQIRQVLLAEAA